MYFLKIIFILKERISTATLHFKDPFLKFKSGLFSEFENHIPRPKSHTSIDVHLAIILSLMIIYCRKWGGLLDDYTRTEF